MNILLLSRYGRKGASSRIRFEQYLPQLKEAGLNILAKPLFNDEYVNGLQQGIREPNQVLSSYIKRLKSVIDSRKYDLVWIEKEVLPWLPAWIEKTLLSKKVPYILDYDDAVFHYYDHHSNRFIRWLLSNKHPTLIRGAQVVVVGNDYLASYAKTSGAKCVHILPSVVDLSRYTNVINQGIKFGSKPTIGWIGQRSTTSFLRPLVPLFNSLSAENLVKFMAIGVDSETLDWPVNSVPWLEETEVETIHQFDVGIMPLSDGPFERGKCGYKLIQYMACGLPVVASPVGVNCKIVEHGVNGYLAETPNEWERAIRTLSADAQLRKRLGMAGRLKVEKQYCLQETGPQLAKILMSAI